MALVFTNMVIILLIFGVWAGNVIARTLQDTPMIVRYEQWMSQHGRVYTDSFEKEGRFEIFKNNVLFIESFNTAGKSYELAINEFADLTNEEFKALRNGFKSPTYKLNAGKITSSYSFVHENGSAPASIDWRKMGAVTPVKSQGQCGCCWAFSAVAAMEGANKLKTGKLISLSEQELIDCDINGLDQGCQGGFINYAFDFIVEHGGLTSTANYPYKGTDLGSCNTRKATNYIAKITGHEDVPANEKALMMAVARQPVSVAIDASSMAMQFYSGGVFIGDCGTNLDHGVTVVGYGTSEDGTKYWLVKNSWGSSWGEEGYIRMERDVEAEEGLCGIAMQASFPTTN